MAGFAECDLTGSKGVYSVIYLPARRSSLVHGGLDRPQLSEMLDR